MCGWFMGQEVGGRARGSGASRRLHGSSVQTHRWTLLLLFSFFPLKFEIFRSAKTGSDVGDSQE